MSTQHNYDTSIPEQPIEDKAYNSPSSSRPRNKVKCKALQQLADERGTEGAAHSIGLNEASLRKILKEGETIKVNELAARFCLEKEPSTVLLIVKADKGERLDMLKQVLKATSIKFMEFVE